MLIAILFISSFTINAQTVDEIIENYIENTGGTENWEKVKSIMYSITVNQMGMEIPIEQYRSSEKIYTKISYQGLEIMQGVFDGKILWSTNINTMKAEKSNQEDIQNVIDELAEFPDPFLKYKENGFIAELMGTESVDGSDVFKIKLTKKPIIVDGEEVPNIEIYYFDIENFIPIMIHQEITSGPAKGTIMEAKMSDYQEVEGIYIPFSRSQGIKDQPGEPLTINSIKLNPEVDNNVFTFPETISEKEDN